MVVSADDESWAQGLDNLADELVAAAIRGEDSRAGDCRSAGRKVSEKEERFGPVSRLAHRDGLGSQSRVGSGPGPEGVGAGQSGQTDASDFQNAKRHVLEVRVERRQFLGN